VGEAREAKGLGGRGELVCRIIKSLGVVLKYHCNSDLKTGIALVNTLIVTALVLMMNLPQTDYDSPWKNILETYFEDFFLFFFPQYHQEINWNKKVEFLDKELQRLTAKDKVGRRYADKLVRVTLVNGKKARILIHVEVQSFSEKNFPERVYIYNYRIFNRYKSRVATFVVFADENQKWRPQVYKNEALGTEIRFKYSCVKLLDYKQRLADLENSKNPFAIIVLAHLQAQQTRNQTQDRKQIKLALIKGMYEQGYSRQDIINLFNFIDWMINLPLDLEKEFLRDLNDYEESKKMRYITSVERIGIEQGIEQGLEQGIEQGIEQGRQEMKEMVLQSLGLLLRIKFGDDSSSIFSEISQISDLEQLRAILNGLETINTLQELRSLYQSAVSH
jgi:hypothetical protein